MTGNIMKYIGNMPACQPVRHLRITLAAIFLLFILTVPGISVAQSKKIAVFGSSVAKGSGDTTVTGGYAGMLKILMEKRGWSVVNVSRGGDNTVKIMPRFEKELLPEKPGYVIIGLSLGNEGITSSSALNRNRVFERFRSGMVHLVNLCRENGMIPVVVNCYTRNDFGQEQYELVQKMNLLINTWEVPSINALGAIDNGSGNWATGYWHDKSHPNEKGHQEIFYSFVPGLFDALAAGKKCPEKSRNNRFLSISEEASGKPLVYMPDDPIHSFSISFQVKSKDEGAIAAINGKNTYVSLLLRKGRIICQINGKETLAADTSNENKGWQYIVLSHRYSTGVTTFSVNGKQAGSYVGPLDFNEFILGGSGIESEPSPRLAGYKDLLIYRSALNLNEVQALYYDQLLQSSLEIYAPLDDLEFRSGSVADNYAQSMSRLFINSYHLAAASEENGTTTK
jgi:lysophospholipase L1-like esterase